MLTHIQEELVLLLLPGTVEVSKEGEREIVVTVGTVALDALGREGEEGGVGCERSL